MKQSPRTRLANNSKLDPSTGCIHWTGGRASNGYGITSTFDNKSILVHRLAWQLENGPIPPTYKGKDSCITHRCCNRTCINPLHLQLDNQQGNMANPVTKARQKQAAKRRGPSLTDAQLTEIHQHFENGKTGYEIAKLTGRSESHISILRRNYVNRKKEDAQTEFIKQVNRRLSDLLFPNRKKPSGSAPSPKSGGAVRAS